MCIDFYNVDDSLMTYRYSINGLTINGSNPYSSQSGTFKLKKVPQCF